MENLRARPIPAQEEMRQRKKRFRSHPLTPVQEVLVEARARGLAGENFYHGSRNPPYYRRIEGAIPGLYLRQSLAEKLTHINTRLKPQGLELFLFDAWRPRAVQAYFHDVWMPEELRRHDPSLTGEELTRKVETYWAAPTQNDASPAPHETGAAVDLTIRWIGGESLWMGSLFDDVTEIAHRDHFEKDTGLSFSNSEARANRRLLHWLMAEEGFAGHPDEWWHFSQGDQLWAALTGAKEARYGLAKPPL